MMEIEATQEQNTRSRGAKTYHLIISFQQGESLPQEELEKIEREFAAAMGFEEHQCIVAAHHNTENFHVHVAYNMIHPETLKIHHPQWDYYRRDRVCRAMEKQYGLAVDHGHDKWLDWRDEGDKVKRPNKGSDRVRDMEAQRWEQSFESFVKEIKQPIMDGIEKASNWLEVHEAFAEQDLELKARGNGLVIGDGTHHIKASTLDRSLSKARLEQRLGQFMADPIGNNPAIASVELSLSGQQKENILTAIEDAKDWTEVHEIFGQHGLELRRRGNGLIISDGDENIKASVFDRSLSRARLEQRFGILPVNAAEHSKNRSNPSQKRFYGLKPALPLKSQQDLWDQFLDKKKRKATMSWREYLLLMAGFDPLAMALIVGYRKIFAELRLSNPIRRGAGSGLASGKHLPTFIRVPFKDSRQVRALGAKWDQEYKSYYIPTNKDLALFEQWAIGLPKVKSKDYSRQKSVQSGAVQGRWYRP
ncbi:MAG: relaxase/mobilization nuclease domain-containing protein [Alphaproteobacteria bacterium]|nr:relaxase/mobilization nuclease domain-containing protein [Alphaproteobacteria bacterium]